VVIKTKKRISRTIPFGYKILKNKKLLYPIKSQLNALKIIKQKILNGTLSLREGSLKLKKETGRSLSYVGLNKIISKEYPNWQIAAKKERDKITIIKKELFEKNKIRIKAERELEKLKKREQKKIIYHNCILCNEKKLLSEFKINKAKYCNNCKKLISIKSQKLYLNCRICKKRKNINEFAGIDGFKAYKTKTCKPCYSEMHKKWKNKNIEHRMNYVRKYRLRNSSDIRKKTSLW
jgi:hypothetical protein